MELQYGFQVRCVGLDGLWVWPWYTVETVGGLLIKDSLMQEIIVILIDIILRKAFINMRPGILKVLSDGIIPKIRIMRVSGLMRHWWLINMIWMSIHLV